MASRWMPIAVFVFAACQPAGSTEPVAPKPVAPPDPVKPVLATPPAMTDSVAGLLGQAVKIDVTEQDGRRYSITDAAKLIAVLEAIGGDQVPTGVRRRCLDTITLNFVDAAGAGKAGLGLCNTTPLSEASALEGPEVYSGEARGGVKLVDEAALKKILLEARAAPATH